MKSKNIKKHQAKEAQTCFIPCSFQASTSRAFRLERGSEGRKERVGVWAVPVDAALPDERPGISVHI
jgi:hypothetical protein